METYKMCPKPFRNLLSANHQGFDVVYAQRFAAKSPGPLRLCFYFLQNDGKSLRLTSAGFRGFWLDVAPRH